jgi:hypothetical protein
MVKCTVQEVRDAHRALRRINEEVRLPQKAAWRVSRLLAKLKPEVVSFEETQLKLFRDAGGVQTGGGVQIDAPERRDDENAMDWAARQKEHRGTLNKLNDELRDLNKNEVEIDYDPLLLALFEDDDTTPKDKRRQFSANDFADVGPFICETEKKE